jgi:hypothetical protein
LQYCGLELHNLTLSGILHIVAFVTLCESYMRIDPHFDLWNYFFHIRRPKDPDAELTILRSMVIHVRHDLDTYFDIPMPISINGWWKKWFYLRNDVKTPLPVFTDNRPIPQPTLGYGVAQKDLGKLHPMREVV